MIGQLPLNFPNQDNDMRVTLNQDEIFQAVADYLRDKLSLDNTASIEISFTAGRSPKGYTADVDITYEKSELASRFTARNDDQLLDQADAGPVTGDTAPEPAEGEIVEASPTEAGTASAVNLFG